MNQQLSIYNSLSRKKEIFESLHPKFVGMYVCGPTVYGEPHLGHARPYITFDVVFRYLQYLGYKVRYLRNITDVGHLVGDADEGEDKIVKKAKLEKLEPMEIVQLYTNSFHEAMNLLNNLPPSIEPTASGHIPEQIEMTEKILNDGFAYKKNGSVYFDVIKYAQKYDYGKLSGRVLEDLMASERELESQDEKNNKADFALWKNAQPEHIMRWNSPFGNGFPGWHLECSAMSSKYLGVPFDIHGGGMDLLFPHHECEIAQSIIANGKSPAKYWMHNNMITINGQKMAKSLGNGINLKELFNGENKLLKQAYSPMTVRFYILQAHYRSTLDFSNEALKSAEKAYKKMINGLKTLKQLSHTEAKDQLNEQLNTEILKTCTQCADGINDDFNTAITIANLFQLLKYINSFKAGILNLSSLKKETFTKLKETYLNYFENILGLKEDETKANPNLKSDLLDLTLKYYEEAKKNKDYSTVDKIRVELKKLGIVINDSKTGFEWAYEE